MSRTASPPLAPPPPRAARGTPYLSTRALQVLVSLEECSTFREVGDRLYLHPSTVSKLLTKLERCLGVRLVGRTTRQLALTPAGRAALEPARQVLAALDCFVDSACRPTTPQRVPPA